MDTIDFPEIRPQRHDLGDDDTGCIVDAAPLHGEFF